VSKRAGAPDLRADACPDLSAHGNGATMQRCSQHPRAAAHATNGPAATHRRRHYRHVQGGPVYTPRKGSIKEARNATHCCGTLRHPQKNASSQLRFRTANAAIWLCQHAAANSVLPVLGPHQELSRNQQQHLHQHLTPDYNSDNNNVNMNTNGNSHSHRYRMETITIH
jgi:hypothetical protein